MFVGWKIIPPLFDDDSKGFELKRSIDFKGIVERMKEKKRLEERERSKPND